MVTDTTQGYINLRLSLEWLFRGSQSTLMFDFGYTNIKSLGRRVTILKMKEFHDNEVHFVSMPER